MGKEGSWFRLLKTRRVFQPENWPPSLAFTTCMSLKEEGLTFYVRRKAPAATPHAKEDGAGNSAENLTIKLVSHSEK